MMIGGIRTLPYDFEELTGPLVEIPTSLAGSMQTHFLGVTPTELW